MTTTELAASPPRRVNVGGRPVAFRLFQLIAWVLIAGWAGSMAVSAVYYGVTQLDWHFTITWWGLHWHWQGPYLKHDWDGLISQPWWALYRHAVRDLSEGIIGSMLIKWLAASWQKRWASRVPDWAVPLLGLATFVAGLALAVGLLWVITFGWKMAVHHTWHVAYYQPPERYTQYIYIAIGFGTGQLTGRIWKPAARTVQLFFAERGARFAASRHRLPLWVTYPLVPPPLRERVVWMAETGNRVRQAAAGKLAAVYDRAFRAAMVSGAAGFIILVGLGAYVRYGIA